MNLGTIIIQYTIGIAILDFHIKLLFKSQRNTQVGSIHKSQSMLHQQSNTGAYYCQNIAALSPHYAVTSNNPSLSMNGNEIRKKIQHFSFSLNDKIGRGYSSIVYKGRNQLTNQTVAIKVIQLKSLSGDQIKKNLLTTELQCMKKIKNNYHQNLLKYIDSYNTVNNCYIITEYCENGDLQKLLRKKGRFTQQQFIVFFKQFISGYQTFASAGYIHRDLKPANIFIKQNNVYKLADYGMVKPLSESPRDAYNVGTPVYMPPQSLNSNIYTQKSDIWSIGVMCYQLLHGVFPWRGIDQRQLKNNIQNTVVSYDYSKISHQLASFLSKCLQKDINKRYSLRDIISDPWFKKTIAQSNQICTNYYQKTGFYENIQNRNSSLKQATTAQILNDKAITAQTPPLRSLTSPKLLHHNNTASVNALLQINNSNPSLIPQIIAVPSLQILQRIQDSYNMNKGAKSQRPTMDSLKPPSCKISSLSPYDLEVPRRKTSLLLPSSSQPLKIPFTPAPSLSSESVNSTKKSPLDFLISILNYLRYVYKIYKIVEQNKGMLLNSRTKNNLIYILLKELIKVLTGQQKCIKNKENIYNFEERNWQEFTNSKKWKTYINVVEQYSKKYRQTYNNFISNNESNNEQDGYYKKERRIAFPLKSILQQFYNTLQGQYSECGGDLTRHTKANMLLGTGSLQQQKYNQYYQLMQLIDYLTTLYNMQQSIFCYGWGIFIDKSSINYIVQCKCTVKDYNYKEVWATLETRVQSIISNKHIQKAEQNVNNIKEMKQNKLFNNSGNNQQVKEILINRLNSTSKNMDNHCIQQNRQNMENKRINDKNSQHTLNKQNNSKINNAKNAGLYTNFNLNKQNILRLYN